MLVWAAFNANSKYSYRCYPKSLEGNGSGDPLVVLMGNYLKSGVSRPKEASNGLQTFSRAFSR